MDELLAALGLIASALVFTVVWRLSLRPPRGSPQRSDFYAWDLERPEKWLTGRRCYDVRRAKQLIHFRPRPVVAIEVEPLRQRVAALPFALQGGERGRRPVDLEFPLVICPGECGVVVIDGWHRIRAALSGGVPTLRAVFLSEEETREVVGEVSG